MVHFTEKVDKEKAIKEERDSKMKVKVEEWINDKFEATNWTYSPAQEIMKVRE